MAFTSKVIFYSLFTIVFLNDNDLLQNQNSTSQVQAQAS